MKSAKTSIKAEHWESDQKIKNKNNGTGKQKCRMQDRKHARCPRFETRQVDKQTWFEESLSQNVSE